jgi:hypothetical protein
MKVRLPCSKRLGELSQSVALRRKLVRIKRPGESVNGTEGGKRREH